jgi:hypothetical protein
MDETPIKKIMSVNLDPANFSLSDFLTLENETNRVSRNISKDISIVKPT